MRLTEPWILQWATLQCTKYICAVQLHFPKLCFATVQSALKWRFQSSVRASETARVGAGLPKAVWHQYAHPDYICAPICPPWLHLLSTNIPTLITYAVCHQYTNMPTLIIFAVCHQYVHPDLVAWWWQGAHEKSCITADDSCHAIQTLCSACNWSTLKNCELSCNWKFKHCKYLQIANLPLVS